CNPDPLTATLHCGQTARICDVVKGCPAPGNVVHAWSITPANQGLSIVGSSSGECVTVLADANANAGPSDKIFHVVDMPTCNGAQIGRAACRECETIVTVAPCQVQYNNEALTTTLRYGLTARICDNVKGGSAAGQVV